MSVDPNDVFADIIANIEADTGNTQISAAQIVWLAMSKAISPYFTSSGGATVDDVTAGSSMVAVSPTTGHVVVDVVPSNFTGIPESAVTGLVSDLAAFASSLAGKANASHTHAQSDVTNLVSDLAAKAPTSRTISTTAPLTGGGDLSANRTLAVNTFGAAQDGVVPLSGGGTSNYLRADGTWAAPPGQVPSARTISTTAPLTGGGDLSANRTLAVNTFGAAQAGVVPLSGGGTANFLRADGSWALPPGTGVTASGMFFMFAGNHDGAVVFDGSSTILTLVPAANVYTLTRDIFVTNMTVDVGVTIRTGGFRIFGTGTLTVNGDINNNGADTGTASGGAGGLGGFYGAGASGGAGGSGANGSPGNAAANCPLFPGVATTTTNLGGPIATVGGNGNVLFRGGGGGGAATLRTGGSAGNITVTAANVGGPTLEALKRGTGDHAITTNFTPGSGGGGGAGGAGGGAGGGGGGGGGIVGVFFTAITGTGTIRAKGGNGGPGNASGGTANGAGGGGGGGLLVIPYGTRGGSWTASVAGGTGGTGNLGGSSGGNGADGVPVLYNLSGDGT